MEAAEQYFKSLSEDSFSLLKKFTADKDAFLEQFTNWFLATELLSRINGKAQDIVDGAREAIAGLRIYL